MTTELSGTLQRLATPVLHHVAVQTEDLDNTVNWYTAFLGCERTWTLEQFSELTLTRLPGIRRLVELVLGSVRFHVFDRPAGGSSGLDAGASQYQHLCFAVGSSAELVGWRERWLALERSGRYAFAVVEEPSELVVDADGVESFYCRDVNGLEFEFTWAPGEST
ncbi:VOC family protein [Amycolatopsis sp. lyj-23]|uniref:VOC family protein n=1 Tax=Amycolatopsis sp. lyj-23 TaxID=2789283 RepID=UPI00397DE2C1